MNMPTIAPKLNVFAVMDATANFARCDNSWNSLDEGDFQDVRAAVAELIEAARECLNTELGEMACVDSMAPCEDALGRLFAAVARVGGAL